MAAKDDNLSLYGEYNKTLRTWLIGFGFGVPALFIVNQGAQDRLLASSDANYIVWLFLAGAAAQVFMAFLNKIVSWCAYHKHDQGDKKVNRAVRFFAAMENLFIIDIVLDIASLVTFGWSIVLIAGLFINA